MSLTDAGDDSVTTSIDIAPTWRSWAGIHGGYLVARACGVGRALAPGLPLRAVHAMFVRPVNAGSSTITVEIVRRGRSATTQVAEVAQDDGRGIAVRLQMLLGAGGTGPAIDGPPVPGVAAPDQCEAFSLPVDLVPFGQHVEIRAATDARPLSGGDVAELVAWIRIPQLGLSAAETLLVLPDALPPALYAIRTSPVPIPSADLAVHLTSPADAADPAAWYLVRIRTEAAGDGWSIDASTVWDERGRLMALGRQARRVLE